MFNTRHIIGIDGLEKVIPEELQYWHKFGNVKGFTLSYDEDCTATAVLTLSADSSCYEIEMTLYNVSGNMALDFENGFFSGFSIDDLTDSGCEKENRFRLYSFEQDIEFEMFCESISVDFVMSSSRYEEHGGNIYKYSADILDFSANINPLGMPPAVKEAVMNSAHLWDRYPDPRCTALREKIAEHDGVSADNIVCGNGAADIIYRMAAALRPKRVLIAEPAFSEYRKAFQLCGSEITEYISKEENGFVPDADITEMITPGTEMVILCSPANPSGRLVPGKVLSEIYKACCENGSLLVIDESFIGFTGKYISEPEDNIIRLRSFTKLYAMPGLRLGYALCGYRNIAHLIMTKGGQYWNVSVPAQEAGIAALGEDDFVRRTVEYVKREREFLLAGMRDAGLTAYDPDANFILFRADEDMFERMLGRGIHIRNCSDFRGLSEGYFRAAVRTHEENERFLTALRASHMTK